MGKGLGVQMNGNITWKCFFTETIIQAVFHATCVVHQLEAECILRLGHPRDYSHQQHRPGEHAQVVRKIQNG